MSFQPEQSISPACLCTVSASMSTFGSANVIHAFGALCRHMRVTVMAAERYQRSKGVHSFLSQSLSLYFFLYIYFHPSSLNFSSSFTSCLCSRLALFANLFLIFHSSIILETLDFTTLEKSGGFMAEIITENTFMRAYKSKCFGF